MALMNTYARQPVAFVRGRGARLQDDSGREYLDFVAGIAVNVLGHAHPRLAAALADQAATLIHTSNLYRIPLQEALADALVRRSFAVEAFFCNSGTEAVEAAIKLARKWWRQKHGETAAAAAGASAAGTTSAHTGGPPPAPRVLTFEKAFHGRTLGALAATGSRKYLDPFLPELPGFVQVPYGDLAAAGAAVSAAEAGSTRASKAAGATCAILVEPVQGEGGVRPAPDGFLQGLRALADEVGALLIFDEVQCGMGRTGTLFAYEHWGVEPDVMTLAKGLGGGVPIGAVLAGPRAAGTLAPGDHGSTFGGNPLACRAALEVLAVLEDEQLLEAARARGAELRAGLEALAARHATVREVRGLGLMQALQLDRPGADLVTLCRERGLLVNCTDTDVLRLLPPLVVTADEVREALTILDDALAAWAPAPAAAAR